MKYKVRYWINVDMLAEEIIESENVNIKTSDLGQFKEPSKNATYTKYFKGEPKTMPPINDTQEEISVPNNPEPINFISKK